MRYAQIVVVIGRAGDTLRDPRVYGGNFRVGFKRCVWATALSAVSVVTIVKFRSEGISASIFLVLAQQVSLRGASTKFQP